MTFAIRVWPCHHPFHLVNGLNPVTEPDWGDSFPVHDPLLGEEESLIIVPWVTEEPEVSERQRGWGFILILSNNSKSRPFILEVNFLSSQLSCAYPVFLILWKTTCPGHQRTGLCLCTVEASSFLLLQKACDTVQTMTRGTLSDHFSHSWDNRYLLCAVPGTLQTILRVSSRSSHRSRELRVPSVILKSFHKKWHCWRIHRPLFIGYLGDCWI